MDIMDIMDIMNILDIMDIMDIMEIVDIRDIMIINAWMAMAGAVSALVTYRVQTLASGHNVLTIGNMSE